MKESAAILLSTYNGAKYLEPLLNSLLDQTYEPLHIYIRDDSSTDNTVQIIEKYKLANVEKISILPITKNLGFNKSFDELLKTAQADYYFFCDQDDIWLPEKVAITVELIKSITFKDEHLPLAAFCNFNYISENKILKNTTQFEQIGIDENYFKYVSINNYSNGCAMGFNEVAKQYYFNTPRYVAFENHIHLICQIFGRETFTTKCLLKYRVHENNTSGTSWLHREPIKQYVLDIVFCLFNRQKYVKLLYDEYFQQFEEFYKTYDNNILQAKEIYRLETINKMPYFKRKLWFIRHFKMLKIKNYFWKAFKEILLS